MKTAIEYLNEIDEHYSWAKRNKVSRFDVRWGTWSATMNRGIKIRIKNEDDSENLKLKYVFIYWSMVSELLELHFKFRFLRSKKKRILLTESIHIKEVITTGNGLQPLSEEDLIKQLFKGMSK